MPTLLHLDSSPRGDRSHSRKLSKMVADAYVAAHPGTTVVTRDLGHEPPPFVTEPMIGAFYTPPDARSPEQREAIAPSDALVDELLSADVIVAGVPMYNFGIPAAMKAWVDQVVRIGRTFDIDPSRPNPYVQLVHGKRLLVASVSGGAGYGEGGSLAAMNFQTPYLRTIFGFMGVTDVAVIEVENATGGDEVLAGQFEAARARIDQVVRA